MSVLSDLAMWMRADLGDLVRRANDADGALESLVGRMFATHQAAQQLLAQATADAEHLRASGSPSDWARQRDAVEQLAAALGLLTAKLDEARGLQHRRLEALLGTDIVAALHGSSAPLARLDTIILTLVTALVHTRERLNASLDHDASLAKQIAAARDAALAWERRAMFAVQAGNDALATENLRHKQEHDQIARARGEEAQRHARALEALRLAMGAIDAKLDEAKRHKRLLAPA